MKVMVKVLLGAVSSSIPSLGGIEEKIDQRLRGLAGNFGDVPGIWVWGQLDRPSRNLPRVMKWRYTFQAEGKEVKARFGPDGQTKVILIPVDEIEEIVIT